MEHNVAGYVLGRTLGSGATGKVKLATHRETNEQVAIKIIEKKQLQSQPGLEDKVKREIALMRLLDHPHILKLLEVCESTGHLYLVLEYGAHGELFDFLVSRRRLKPQNAMGLFREIVYGLDYMHSIGICHRDLKTENLLLDEYDHILIADFGFARWMRSNLAETSCGSPHYTAPEVIRGVQYDGRGADVWSAGVILYAMAIGALPFAGETREDTANAVLADEPEWPEGLDPRLLDLLKKMLSKEVDGRLGLEQIAAHPWVLGTEQGEKTVRVGKKTQVPASESPPKGWWQRLKAMLTKKA
jgi:BR serine/threonine kinase